MHLILPPEKMPPAVMQDRKQSRLILPSGFPRWLMLMNRCKAATGNGSDRAAEKVQRPPGQLFSLNTYEPRGEVTVHGNSKQATFSAWVSRDIRGDRLNVPVIPGRRV